MSVLSNSSSVLVRSQCYYIEENKLPKITNSFLGVVLLGLIYVQYLLSAKRCKIRDECQKPFQI